MFSIRKPSEDGKEYVYFSRLLGLNGSEWVYNYHDAMKLIARQAADGIICELKLRHAKPEEYEIVVLE